MTRGVGGRAFIGNLRCRRNIHNLAEGRSPPRGGRADAAGRPKPESGCDLQAGDVWGRPRVAGVLCVCKVPDLVVTESQIPASYAARRGGHLSNKSKRRARWNAALLGADGAASFLVRERTHELSGRPLARRILFPSRRPRPIVPVVQIFCFVGVESIRFGGNDLGGITSSFDSSVQPIPMHNDRSSTCGHHRRGRDVNDEDEGRQHRTCAPACYSGWRPRCCCCCSAPRPWRRRPFSARRKAARRPSPRPRTAPASAWRGGPVRWGRCWVAGRSASASIQRPRRGIEMDRSNAPDVGK